MRVSQQLMQMEIEIRGLEKRIEAMRAALVPPTIRWIINMVADYYKIPQMAIISQRRHVPILRVRLVAIYLAKHFTAKSLPVIGRAFGDRDHTTILNALRKVERTMIADEKMRREIAELSEYIHANFPIFRDTAPPLQEVA